MSIQKQPTDVVALVGAGSIGQAIVRQVASGKKVLLGDLSEENLKKVANNLSNDGFDVETMKIDASKRDDLHQFAQRAASYGSVKYYIHTAGVSPHQADASGALKVDLVGTSIAIDEFGQVIAPGGAGLVVSSQAGYMFPDMYTREELNKIVNTNPEEMMKLDLLDSKHVPNGGVAYGLSKLINQLYVQKASLAWGKKGARINSISPGIIITPLAKDELASDGAAGYQSMIKNSATGRTGTPDEVGQAAAFLLSDTASFITGTDLLIDGGVIAAMRNGKIQL